jgi:hypothetical protein
VQWPLGPEESIFWGEVHMSEAESLKPEPPFNVDLKNSIRCLGPFCHVLTPLLLEYTPQLGVVFDQLVPKVMPVRKDFQSVGSGWMCPSCHTMYTRWLTIRAAETKAIGERIASELNEKLDAIRTAYDAEEATWIDTPRGIQERKQTLHDLSKKYSAMMDSTRAEYGTKYEQELHKHLSTEKLDTFAAFRNRPFDARATDNRLIAEALDRK